MIRSLGARFVDEHGRTLLPRGVNLGGSSKVPRVPDGATHLPGNLDDPRGMSFVGRPFPLEEADEHFSRLAHWGLTFERLIVTWEAVEHAGPGIYDEAYLDYLRALMERAHHHGISVVIDPHQDTWSRFSGGDGAPGWTLEAAGFDLGALDDTAAAFTHQRRGDPLPHLLWVTNGGKLAAATMFTLFFGGNDFAPRTRVDGRPIQDFLQDRYLAAMVRVARCLRGLPNVVGYGTMNEPLCGYIGWDDLQRPRGQLTLGEGPTPLQGMALGAGIPQEVGIWTMRTASISRSGTQLLNRQGRRAWKPGRDCPWRAHGVWDVDPSGMPRLLKPDYFCRVRGRAVDFTNDYLRPFAEGFWRAIRGVDPEAMVFLESEAGEAPLPWDLAAYPGVVFAPHWYDDLTLVKRHYLSFAGVAPRSHRPVIGRRAVERTFREALVAFRREARERIGEVPVLLAEFGIPFDLDGGKAYRNGAFRAHVRALDRSFRAIESALLANTIWNYSADNSNARGDQWNGEDLSIFSRDQQADPSNPDSGGRALAALVRPWPLATAGEPLRTRFDPARRRFCFEFRHDPRVSEPTEIFLPHLHYPHGCVVELSDGAFQHLPERQLLVYRHDPGRPVHRLVVRPARRK
ncbi:MAG TPA: cellulase family glycosylhydrolase [Spirochaetia bacterium]|nr:cellulase family glycosylhydrolase [Spirochaetia bacterium]